RMVVFGGTNGSLLSEVWALSLAGPPAWAQLSPGGTPPAARSRHSAIYDVLHDRMIVFGGSNGSALNDVCALSFAGTPSWITLTPAGTPPSPRLGQSAIYDNTHAGMLLFGGSDASGVRNDVWALSLSGAPAWSAVIPTGTPPGARDQSASIYDPVRGRMIVLGGHFYQDYDRYLNDVSALSLSGTPSWTALTTAQVIPIGRDAQSAIYDPVRQRMVVYGGEWTPSGLSNLYSLGDLWTLSLTGPPLWTRLTPSGTPPDPRSGHSAIYDPVRDRMLMFGGTRYDSYGTYYYNDVWELSLAGTPAWNQLTPSGTAPGWRYGHSAIYDPVRDRMVVFGGYYVYGGWVNDLWSLSLAGAPQWDQLSPAGTPPAPRARHGAIYDPVRDRMVVFGGYGGSSGLNDVWALPLASTPTWAEITPTGGPPGGDGGAAIYDPVRDRALVFGGSNTLALSDLWALPLSGAPAWSQLTHTNTPPQGRWGFASIYDSANDRMAVFGGSYLDCCGDAIGRNDVWALYLNTGPLGVTEHGPQVFTGILRAPTPNPSPGGTTLSYSIARAGRVRLYVYDASGRLVRRLIDGERPAGEENVSWDGSDDSGAKLRAGLY
ncbi:MAG: Kelch repeat-containing protein, partial [Gaiellaceae bacterium]